MGSTQSGGLLVGFQRSIHANGCCPRTLQPRRVGAPSASSSSSSRTLSFLATHPRRRPRQQLGARHGGLRNGCFSYSSYRQGKQPRRIAVLGGGMTGLTAAHYLARHAPDAHITLYDAMPSLGGWVQAQKVRVSGGQDASEVLFQHGPRMLRTPRKALKFDDLVFLDVAANLGIGDKITTPRSRAGTRYIYYPDHLVKLPGLKMTSENIVETVDSLFTEPLWAGLFPSALGALNNYGRTVLRREYSRWDQENAFEADESAGDFITRSAGGNRQLVDNVVSAMFHGIYGGDVWKLSAKQTILEGMWISQAGPSDFGFKWIAKKDEGLAYNLATESVTRIAQRLEGSNLMAFEDGLITLVDSMVEDLGRQRNVTIESGTPVKRLSHTGAYVELESAHGKKVWYDQVLSTLFSGDVANLARRADQSHSLPSLAQTRAVTIMVVNLWYPNPELLRENHGFGYLIPQSVSDELNPECALGVLFDSDLQLKAEKPGTKLTVMLGGHYWDDWSILPSGATGIQMARAVVERHLGISEYENVFASARLCRNCIPQQTVGHRERMRDAHSELQAVFKGQLTVAGPSYTSVGVMPAMRAGYDAAMRIATGKGQSWTRRQPTVTRDGSTYDKPSEQVWDHVGTTGLQWAEGKQYFEHAKVPWDFGMNVRNGAFSAPGEGSRTASEKRSDR